MRLLPNSHRLVLLATLTSALFGLIPHAGASITLSGDTVPNSTGGADPWNVGGTLTIGTSSVGGMSVDLGSDVSSTLGIIAASSAAVGNVTIDGAGSTWANSSTLAVGSGGKGTLVIQNGAAVSDPFGTIGNLSTGNGTLIVDGAGSTWTSTSLLNVGPSGIGRLNVQNGAAVSGASGGIGLGATGNGTVTVEGLGSTWTSSGALTVGTNGRGTLNINNNGLVIAAALNGGNLNSAVNFGGGTLRITATDSATNIIALGAGGGTFDVPNAGTTLTLNTNANGGGIGGTGKLTKTGAGALALTANNSYSGDTLVSAGTLALSGAGAIASSPTITVKSGATLDVSNVTSGANFDGTRFALQSGQTLKGNGTVAGAIDLAFGATLAPGESTGTLATPSISFAGGATFNPEIDLGAVLAADLLNVSGTVSLNESSLDVSLLNIPSAQTLPKTFLLINNDLNDAVSGEFGFIFNPIGYTVSVDYGFTGTDALGRNGDGNDIAVTVGLVPEPGMLAPLIGSAIMMRRRRAPVRAGGYGREMALKWTFLHRLVVLSCLACSASIRASDLLYESTQMGAPNQPSGFSIYSNQFLGVRFQLTTPATIDAIGGHMFGSPSGNGLFFGALVKLTSLDDFPDSADFSTPDVLAHMSFHPPTSSADVTAPIGPIAVPAGFYAEVFGSGLFGATGNGGAPDDNVPNDATAPYNLRYLSGFGWDRIGSRGVRFTAYGVVPEPGVLLAVMPLAAALVRRRRRP